MCHEIVAKKGPELVTRRGIARVPVSRNRATLAWGVEQKRADQTFSIVIERAWSATIRLSFASHPRAASGASLRSRPSRPTYCARHTTSRAMPCCRHGSVVFPPASLCLKIAMTAHSENLKLYADRRSVESLFCSYMAVLVATRTGSMQDGRVCAGIFSYSARGHGASGN